MTDQLAIDFASPTARRTDPATSHEAAVIAIRNAANNRVRAYDALIAAGPEGLTDFELADVTGVQQTSVGKRRGELRDAGLVVALVRDGGSVRRPSPTGSPAQVWVAVELLPLAERAQ